jgi:hypothetical protein
MGFMKKGRTGYREIKRAIRLFEDNSSTLAATLFN